MAPMCIAPGQCVRGALSITHQPRFDRGLSPIAETADMRAASPEQVEGFVLRNKFGLVEALSHETQSAFDGRPRMFLAVGSSENAAAAAFERCAYNHRELPKQLALGVIWTDL